MHFVIYIPGDVKPAALADVGLPGLVAGAWIKTVSPGPDGKTGTLFGWRAFSGKMYHEYNPAQQTWLAAEPLAEEDQPAGRYWVGYKTDSPPIPDELQRAKPYRGLKHMLGDGHEWYFPREVMLPQDIRLSGDGTWAAFPQRMFDEFCESCRVMRALIALAPEKRRAIFLDELIRFIREAFAINYRTCPELESAIGLWNTSQFQGPENLLLSIISKAGDE